MANANISLDDKFNATEGRVYITGTQALVRLLLTQRRLDKAAGLDTAGFVSGYRGSPLGNFDDALWRAKKQLAAHDVVFQPGVNEELAATACWGSQQADLFKPKHQGVFALWYGKGPGVDRSGDVLKHGNFAGAAKHGGVLVVAGDDHGAKSSTTAHQSDQALEAAMIPVLSPASVEDILEFGLKGWALSRFSGLWVGLKVVTDVVETTTIADLSVERFALALPTIDQPPRGLNITLQFLPKEEEAIVTRYRLPAAEAFARANRFDRVIHPSQRGGLSIVAIGKAYADTRAALAMLGLDRERAEALGLGLYKIGLAWPIEREGLCDFARGARELLIVEEKRPFVELQAAAALYHLPADERPALSGKRAPTGEPLLQSDGEFSPAVIALAILRRLEELGATDEALRERAGAIRERLERSPSVRPPAIARSPAFCSGCPHNTSTRLPEGSLALAGIGCHTMAHYMPDRPTAPPTQMGGEGANWVGAAPFSNTDHVFQNLGDGTYFHSGLIAIRAAVAAKVNITYKILYNDAVAMTGGQPVDGTLSVRDVVRQLSAEGVAPIYVVSDDPSRHVGLHGLAEIAHRDDLLAVEERLRTVRGASAIVYEQTCAAEKRRRRKKGEFYDPPKRYFINDLVCEGCGDCSVQSNCVSIQPRETPFGRKREIDQSSCNKDYSCVKGFCPSFITVEGGALRKPAGIDGAAIDAMAADLPAPRSTDLQGSYAIYVAGIGGTGVVTIGAVLGMAAHLEGLACTILDVTGLSQKNGAVTSHLQIAKRAEDISASRIGPGACDLLLGCDIVVSGGAEALATTSPERTRGVVNTHMTPTAAFQFTPDMDFQRQGFERAIRAALDGKADFLDATAAAIAFNGDSIAANMMMVGYALQRGLLPVSAAAIARAIEMNGVAVAMNKRALALGRLLAADPEGAARLLGLGEGEKSPEESLEELKWRRAAFLTAYQDEAYAQAYLDFVKWTESRENAATGATDITRAVARYLFKLMAYKDEYEVARLHLDPEQRDRLKSTFEGDVKLSYNLAPPLIAPKDKRTGLPKKISVPAGLVDWAFRLLVSMRRLRGTRFDIFGYTHERRTERRLIEDYKAVMTEVLDALAPENATLALKLAQIPERIRGYGYVKEKHLAAAKREEAELLQRWRSPAAQAPKPAALEAVK